MRKQRQKSYCLYKMSRSALSDELSQAEMKKKEFLEQMDRIIPWGGWIGIIKPHYDSGARGNKPFEVERTSFACP